MKIVSCMILALACANGNGQLWDGGVSLFPVSRPYYYRSPFSGMPDLTYALSRPNKIADQFFGMPLKAREGTGASELSFEKDSFKISLDVHHFKPDELTVKTTDKLITVEGKHEEKPDEHGRVFRHFKRIYDIPEGVKSEEIKGSISSDGVLIIEGPRKPSEDTSDKEKIISIQQTNQPALQSHSSKSEESQTKPSLVAQAPETTTVNSAEESSEESGDLKLKAQTVLNQKLVEQGEKDRLKDLLRSRLIECGWRDRMKLLCREKIQKTGVDNVTVDSLIGEITKEARASIPDSVKRELLDKIKAFLIEQTGSQ